MDLQRTLADSLRTINFTRRVTHSLWFGRQRSSISLSGLPHVYWQDKEVTNTQYYSRELVSSPTVAMTIIHRHAKHFEHLRRLANASCGTHLSCGESPEEGGDLRAAFRKSYERVQPLWQRKSSLVRRQRGFGRIQRGFPDMARHSVDDAVILGGAERAVPGVTRPGVDPAESQRRPGVQWPAV